MYQPRNKVENPQPTKDQASIRTLPRKALATAIALSALSSINSQAACNFLITTTFNETCFLVGTAANNYTVSATGQVIADGGISFQDTGFFFSSLTPVINGSITNAGLIQARLRGIDITSTSTGTNTIINSGQITVLSSSNVFEVGVLANNTSATLINNSGTIAVGGNGFGTGINLFGGTSNSTITNTGLISVGSTGVALAGGTNNIINNQAGGVIQGIFGVNISSGSGHQINNDGSILGFNGGVGVKFDAAGNSLINNGTVSAAGAGIALDLTANALNTVINNNALLSSGFKGIRLDGANGFVINNNNGATIQALNSSGVAVSLSNANGGSFTNLGTVSAITNSSGIVSSAQNITITNSGTISADPSGTTGFGINLISGAVNNTINNSGAISAGFSGINIAAGNHTINNLTGGDISGLIALNLAATAGTATIDNAGDISATDAGIGIKVSNNDNTINNSGKVTAAGAGVAVDLIGDGNQLSNSGQISSGFSGVRISGSNNSVNNNSGGSISANGVGGIGLALNGSNNSASNSGDISGSNAGVALDGVNASLNNTGSVSGDTGVNVGGENASVSNTGTINGNTIGVALTGRNSSIDNSGVINSQGIGISLSGDGSHFTNTGTINAEVSIDNAFAAASSVIINNGELMANNNGIGLRLNAVETTLINNKLIGAANAGIGVDISQSSSGSEVINNDTIESGFRGIRTQGENTTINNKAAATIAATDNNTAAIEINKANGSIVNNDGSITAATAGAAILSNANLITIENNNRISAGESGVGISFISGADNSVINNHAAIDAGFAGILIADGAHTINNHSNGEVAALIGLKISAGANGNKIDNQGSFTGADDGIGIALQSSNNTLNNDGTLSAAGAGVGLDVQNSANNTITNSGTISSGFRGIQLVNATGTEINNTGNISAEGNSVGISLSNNSSKSIINNSGKIESGLAAVMITGSANTLNNTGEGTLSRVIESGANGSIINNAGAITAAGQSALFIASDSDASINNSKDATVSLSSNNEFSSAVYALGNFSGSLRNAGNIKTTDGSPNVSVDDLNKPTAESSGVYIQQLSGNFDNSGSINNSIENDNRNGYGVLIGELDREAVFNNSASITVNDSNRGTGFRSSVGILSFQNGASFNNTATLNSLYLGNGTITASNQANSSYLFNLNGGGYINSIIVESSSSTDSVTQLKINDHWRLPTSILGTAVDAALGPRITTADNISTTLNTGQSMVHGNLQFGANNELIATLSPTGQHSQLLVSGAVLLPQTTSITLSGLSEEYRHGQGFLLIDGGQGSQISFNGSIFDDQPLSRFDAISNGQDLIVLVDNASTSAPNLVSLYSNDLASRDPELAQYLNLQSQASNISFEALSKQFIPDTSASLFNSFLIGQAASNLTVEQHINQRASTYGNRPYGGGASAEQANNGSPSNWQPWFEAYQRHARQDSHLTGGSLNTDITGFNFGLDSQLSNNTLVGFGIGRRDINNDISENRFQNNYDHWQAFAYGHHLFNKNDASNGFFSSGANPFDFATLLLAYGRSDIEQDRQIFLDQNSRRLSAHYRAKTTSAQLTLGKNLLIAKDLELIPSLGLNYNKLDHNGFQENGGNAANLIVAKDSNESAAAKLNLKLQKSVITETAVYKPSVYFGWQRELIDNAVTNTARYVGASTAASSQFQTATLNTADDQFNLGVSISRESDSGLQLTASYDITRAQGIKSHGGLLNVRWNTDVQSLLKNTGQKPNYSKILHSSSRSSSFDGVAIDMAALSPLQLNVADVNVSSNGLGPISAISDYRYSSLTLFGQNIESSYLNEGASDGFRQVATYIGNTPIFTGTGLADFDHINYFERYDVDSVELNSSSAAYGQSSTAGVVKYSANLPLLNESSYKLGLSGSRLEGARSGELGSNVDLTFNLPIGDTLAFRFAGGRLKTEGTTEYRNLYKLRNPNNSNDLTPLNADASRGFVLGSDFESSEGVNDFYSNYGRASLLWEFSDSLDALLTAHHQNDSRGGNRVGTQGADGFGNLYGPGQSGALIAEPKQREANNLALDVNYQAQDWKLNLNSSRYYHQGRLLDDVTGVATNVTFLTSDLDYCSNVNSQSANNITEEFCDTTNYRLGSSRPLVVLDRRFKQKGLSHQLTLSSELNQGWQYLIGIFYHEDNTDKTRSLSKPGFVDYYQNNLTAVSTPQQVRSDIWSQQFEQNNLSEFNVFTKVDYDFNERLSASLGLRFNDYESDLDTQRAFPMFLNEDLSSPRFSTIEATGQFEDRAWLPSLELSYLMGDTTLGLQLERSLKAGGNNANALIANQANKNQYGSETIDHFSVNASGSLFNSTLRYEASVFNRQSNNKQISALIDTVDTRHQLNQVVIDNLKSAEQTGFQLKVKSSITPQWSYALDYTHLFTAQSSSDYSVPAASILASSVNSSAIQTIASGTDLAFTPKNSLVLKTNYHWDLDSSSVDLFATASYRNSSKDRFGANAETIGSQRQINLGMSIYWDAVDLTFWANNINNNQASASQSVNASGPLQDLSYYGSNQTRTLALPRNIGISVNYRY